MLLRLTLYATLGLVLDALDIEFNTWGFWSILTLFICAEHITRISVVEQLQAELAQMRAQAKKDTGND